MAFEVTTKAQIKGTDLDTVVREVRQKRQENPRPVQHSANVGHCSDSLTDGYLLLIKYRHIGYD
ncbi:MULTISPECIES: hypothetical protein [unclassified Nostoc]|uniref:hypothetical protein n=1 Tax=unclassified Nostoc TaxID=2593658 RepID=UPI00167AB681|nr:hypothetical protein [Nostoc sp. 'Peltigera membranacea cyanobiont' 232]